MSVCVNNEAHRSGVLCVYVEGVCAQVSGHGLRPSRGLCTSVIRLLCAEGWTDQITSLPHRPNVLIFMQITANQF